jgi:phosphohistidine phosphatase
MNASKTLLLLRHAKSSWDDPALADHDRPLALRGRKAAKLIGGYLRERETPVSLVLCSSAVRTRETLELASPGGEVEIESGLYGASADELLARLRRVDEGVDSVMLIGHNPAVHDLAVRLAREPGELVHGKFPTGALATFAVPGAWATLEAGQARLTAYVKPRELG